MEKENEENLKSKNEEKRGEGLQEKKRCRIDGLTKVKENSHPLQGSFLFSRSWYYWHRNPKNFSIFTLLFSHTTSHHSTHWSLKKFRLR